MKRDQAEAGAKLIQSVVPTQARVKVFNHGSSTPAGYFLSIAKGGEQSVVHNVEGVADYIKKVVNGGRDGAATAPVTTGTTTPASHPSNGSNGNGARSS